MLLKVESVDKVMVLLLLITNAAMMHSLVT